MYSKLFETPTNKQLTTGTATSEALNVPTHEAFKTLAEVLPPPEIQVMVLDYLLFVDFLPWAQYIPFQVLSFRAMWNARFRECVAWEEYDVVQSMLRQDPFLMVNQGPIRDCSGRIFENTSGFEYAIWALSAPMWELMLDSVPDTPESHELISTLLSQYNRVFTVGVTYNLNGKTRTETSFSFDCIIKPLRSLVDWLNITTWAGQYTRAVSSAQNLLPMHVVDYYCSSANSFETQSQMGSRPKSTRTFFNKRTNLHEDWFHVNSLRGDKFFVYKSSENGAVTLDFSDTSLSSYEVASQGCQQDLAAIDTLRFKNKVKLVDLWEKLEALKVLNPLARALPAAGAAQELVLDYLPPGDFLPWMKCFPHLPLFFKPMWGNRFRQYVALENEEQVRFMLIKEPYLMVQKGEITDHTGAVFDNTSGFEYALRVRNKSMCELMIACIPDTVEGLTLKATLLPQYNIVFTEGAQSTSGPTY